MLASHYDAWRSKHILSRQNILFRPHLRSLDNSTIQIMLSDMNFNVYEHGSFISIYDDIDEV